MSISKSTNNNHPENRLYLVNHHHITSSGKSISDQGKQTEQLVQEFKNTVSFSPQNAGCLPEYQNCLSRFYNNLNNFTAVLETQGRSRQKIGENIINSIAHIVQLDESNNFLKSTI